MSRKSGMTQNDERTAEDLLKLERTHPRIARVLSWLYRNKLVLSFLIGMIYRAVKHYLEWIFEW